MDKKTILLTGIAGFIGSNLLVYLVKKYPTSYFIGLDKISYCSSLDNFKEKIDYKNFEFVKCDLKNIKSIKEVFKKHKIDIIVHLAAYTHVDLSFGNSIKFTKNNVLAGHNLIECCRIFNQQYKLEKFIHISTDEVYGSKNTISTENSILDPTNPYSATKAATEHILKSYHYSFGLPLTITRGNNVYGPKQYPDKVVPLFVMNLLKNKKCKIHGSGEQKRSFLYVDDCVKAFETIILKGKNGEIYNIGSEDEFSINELYKVILKKMKPGVKVEEVGKWKEQEKDREFNDIRYRISIEKLKKLGWKQETKFLEGLEKTIEWYKKNRNRY